jgi:hypothetical protein
VAISGDTVLVGSARKVYIFEKPAAGWRNMHEVAQLTGDFGGFVAIDGDTVVLGSYPADLVFVKPAGGVGINIVVSSATEAGLQRLQPRAFHQRRYRDPALRCRRPF